VVEFQDRFSAGAARYAAHRPSYPRDLIDFLAAVAPRREVAWDAGCGSGQLSVPLAERFDQVIATDASAGQIDSANRHPRIEYRKARAEASGLPDNSADLAVSAQAAHWFDIDRYYDEVRRVGRPDAVIALVTYGAVSADNEIDSIVERFYSEILGPYWAPERRHVEDGYRSLRFPFEEIAAPHLEIQARWALGDLIGYIGTWSAVAALEAAEGRDPFDAFERELTRAWSSGPLVRRVRWPLTVRAGHVR
jgi:SAM-dependent methyltransferase